MLRTANPQMRMVEGRTSVHYSGRPLLRTRCSSWCDGAVTAEALHQGRQSYDRKAWADAFAQLSAADHDAPLESDDLERLAVSARLLGRDADGDALFERGHHERMNRGDTRGAARWALWLGMSLMDRGETARGGGWLARAKRLLDDSQQECVEQGFLLVPVALQALVGGDAATAHATFAQAAKIGDLYHEPDLMALGRLGLGQSSIMLGEITDGLALLDETMVAVTAGEVSPIISGIIYCAVIDACQEVFDLRRAREWTTALTRWCESQPDLVPFNGQCLVHRAEIMQLHGAWPDAVDAAQRARERFVQSRHPAVGAALYRLAELHRLRGGFADAEEAYRQASQWGHQTQPGLAQLRLAQGQVDAAQAAIRLALHETQAPMLRPRLLAAHVEIMLAAKDVNAARAAADDLSEIADQVGAPLLRAMAAYTKGSVLLAVGHARDALAALRQAWTAWHELDAPYETARTRVLIGLTCRALGDEDTARMEFDAAAWIFDQLGAAPDVARAEALAHRAAKPQGGLTARETQVLRHVASGKTNRAIAAELFLSEKTVARHVSNIFTKLGLSSRAAATAYAYEHDLV
jgi:DNA-binding CsgD family transcriptional regulator